MAVGHRTRGELRGDECAATAAVVDDNLLAEGLGKFLREAARHDVGGATGWRRRDETDGFGGVGIGCVCAGQCGTGEQCGE